MATAKSSLAVCMFGLAVLGSCELVKTPPTPVADNTFLDLLAGWRLRVITPELKNRDQPLVPVVVDGPLGLEVKATPNLKGFETQYYELRGSGARVRLTFSQATLTVNGATELEKRPLRAYFPLPAGPLHLRLIYLTRSNGAPHNMALVFTRKAMALPAFAEEVSRSPEVCDSQPDWCLWIPANVAVIAERRLGLSGAEAWGPVQ